MGLSGKLGTPKNPPVDDDFPDFLIAIPKGYLRNSDSPGHRAIGEGAPDSDVLTAPGEEVGRAMISGMKNMDSSNSSCSNTCISKKGS